MPCFKRQPNFHLHNNKKRNVWPDGPWPIYYSILHFTFLFQTCGYMVSFDKMIKWLHTIIQKRFHLTVKAQNNRNNNENVTGTPDTKVICGSVWEKGYSD